METELIETLNKADVVSVKKINPWAKVFLGLTGGVAIGLSVVSAPFLLPALRKYCLPFVPATVTQVENVMQLLPKKAQNGRKLKLLDIGSGDGRIVIATSTTGIESHGVELNTILVLYSKLKAFLTKTDGKTRFFKRDLWKFDFSPYNYVVIFGVEQMMIDLERKLLKELNPGSEIIACRFPLPNLEPEKIIGLGVDTVWLYKIS